MATRNLMGKSRKPGDPYLVFSGPFGPTEVLKSWQANDSKPYGRWFVAVNGDLGDSYVHDIVQNGQLIAWDEYHFTTDQVAEILNNARQAPAASF